ncbi:MAG: CoA transferase, partial [Elusimicrobia bacterium]|nr:CoA transferase [Elusimicrobiota bacterium]
GYGQTGPDWDRPVPGLIVQGMSGVMNSNGDASKGWAALPDLLAGLYAVQGILLALMARERTGRGQWVDISMLDGMISFLPYEAGLYFQTGRANGSRGSAHPALCPCEAFRASDGFFNLAVCSEKTWAAFCDAIERPDLLKDPRFKTNVERVQNRTELNKIVERIFAKKTKDEWLRSFEEKGVAAGPIYSLDQTMDQPQVKARDMLMCFPHKRADKIKLLGVPVKLSETPGIPQGSPPLLGEHTQEIFQSFGEEPPSY